MAPRTSSPERYAAQMGELWSDLSRVLDRLDRLAAEPERLESDDAETALARLRYQLHLANEHAYGLDPPAGAESAHAELSAALASARDATAEVAEAAHDAGRDGVLPLLHEWRGALFRLRLARLRLAAPQPRRRPAAEPTPDEGVARPLVAFLLALFGALAFAAGATLGLWPVWVAGLVAVCGSVVAYRP
jgi:hypothetical protein